MGAGVLSPG